MSNMTVSSDASFGQCLRAGCGNPASFRRHEGDAVVEQLCGKHRSEDVEQSNARARLEQKAQRELIAPPEQYTTVVLGVSTSVNLEGSYYASVNNPMLSCPVGFGSTPYRALAELGRHIAENADRILHKIVEDEMDIRAREAGI